MEAQDQKEARRCTATAKGTGQRCKRRPIIGGMVCKKHGGGAPQVQAKAAQRIRDMLADAIDPDCAMRETARIAYSDIRQVFTPEGKLLPIKDWPEDIARSVSSIEFVTGNVDKGDGKSDDVVRIKLWDKGRAVQDLMKHHGKLTEKVEHTGGMEITWKNSES